MEKMLEEVEYCKAVVKKRFNKPLVMTEDVMNNALELWISVTFVVIKIQTKTCALETIATSLENLGAQLTKSVT